MSGQHRGRAIFGRKFTCSVCKLAFGAFPGKDGPVLRKHQTAFFAQRGPHGCAGSYLPPASEPTPGRQPGACSPACVHLMEAATLSAQLVEAEEARVRALGLLNRWLSQHHHGGVSDPCGVAPELVAETCAAVRSLDPG